MNSKQPIFVYVEDDGPSVAVMKMVIEWVMKCDGVELLSMQRNGSQFKKSRAIALTASVTIE